MPWIAAPSSLMQLAADASRRFTDALAAGPVADIRSAIIARCDEPWVVECVRALGSRCLTVEGVYTFDGQGEDEEAPTPWPGLLVRVTRTPWRPDRDAREGFVLLYSDAEGQVEAATMDGYRAERLQKKTPNEGGFPAEQVVP